MSMEVDYTTPLTDEERAFLLERGRYADVERADNAFGTSTDASLLEGDGTAPGERQLATGAALAQRKEELLAELRLIQAAEGGEPGAPEEQDLPPYEQWKVSELDKELRARQLSTDGNKDEKVARLYQDDDQSNV